ncbi:MAG: HEPN domain-containing protein [Candidatus Caldarchaeum sp.]|nr:HEPN domain-containing protein [Candidatus Caldarchaeum sp.]MCS7137836.1 HEPN domain-containing protein [Candidatus Caldarchaeum sp.]
MWEKWLDKARRFMQYAETDFHNSAAFYPRQAAELMLKGV